MKTLNINKLHIIASEYGSNEDLSRIYVVMKTIDGKYDDPPTCVVELESKFVGDVQPYHQFYKFCYPVPIELSQEQMQSLIKRFLSFPIKDQRKLMRLYDPDVFDKVEPIDVSELKAYVKKNLLLPLSDAEFNHIEMGFRLRWNYSTGQFVGFGGFKRSVSQYLTSIEYPMDKDKMAKIVDLILEYFEWIGQWGNKDDF